MGKTSSKQSQKWVFLAQNDELGDSGSICFWSKIRSKSRFFDLIKGSNKAFLRQI